MKRVLLLVATNVAVLLVLSVTLRLLGVDRILDESGAGLNMNALLVFSAVLGFGGSFISLALSKTLAKTSMGVRVIPEARTPTEVWLLDTVARHAKAAGIGMPEVGIFDTPAMNAFATGARRDSALVAVSTGLLNGMGRKEAEAVIGHEISHVANGDMVTLTLIQGVVNTFVIFLSRIIGHTVDRVVFKTERGYGPAYLITVIVAQLVLGILATMIVMWFSRYREFRADAGGARLVGRDPMVAALERLRQAHPEPLPEQMRAFGISGSVGQGLKRLFMSHPPLEERIQALLRLETR